MCYHLIYNDYTNGQMHVVVVIITMIIAIIIIQN